MKKKEFFLEYVLCGLLVGQALTNFLHLYIFVILFVVINVLTYKIEGFRLDSLYYPPIACLLIYGLIYQNQTIKMIVGGSVLMMQISNEKIYHLPVNKKIIGFKKEILQQKIIYYQFYPLDTSKQHQVRSILWNQGDTVDKIIKSKGLNKLTQLYYKITLSYLQKINLKIGIGSQKATSNGMLFFQGKGTTPFWYSSILIHFASNDLKVSSLQYDELQFQLQKEQELVDKYYDTLLKMQCKNIILMGNTTSCRIIIKLYEKYKDKLHKKITHIILLNPCFKLSEQTSIPQVKINIPILIISNYHFLHFQNIYNDIHNFIQNQTKIDFIVWKKGTIINQTDLTFVISSSGNQTQAEFNFQMNLQAINKFMKNQKVQQSFGELQFGRNYKPQQFQRFYYSF